jgi:hypothetical protein
MLQTAITANSNRGEGKRRKSAPESSKDSSKDRVVKTVVKRQ